MPWIIIAAVATASSVFILMLVNTYLYHTYRERFMKVWAWAWGVHTLRYLFLIATVLWPSSYIFKELNYLCIIFSAGLLLTGTRIFMGKPVGRRDTLIGLLIALWITATMSMALPVMNAVIPLFAFLSYSYILTGIQFLKEAPRGGQASRITGWLFIVWGLHQSDYPLLRPIAWFAPWGFLIGGILATTVAIGMVLIYFERTHQALKEKEDRHENLIVSSHNWIWEVDANAAYTYASPQIQSLLGYAPEEILGKTPFDLMPEEEASRVKMIFDAIADRREPFFRLENTNRHKNGTLVVLETSGVPFYDSQGRLCGYRGTDQDITHHKQAETRRDLSNHVLQLLNDSRDLSSSIEQVIDLLQTRIDFDAVGIRLKEGDDYPYVAQSGFPPELLVSENSLVKRGPQGEVCRDLDGAVCLECTCGMVITGKIPKDTPLFTSGGSFWTNDAPALLGLPVAQNLRGTARNRCIHHGYASIALIPLRYKEKIVGLIHCMDHRKDRLSLELVECLEGIAAYLGAALTRKWYEEERINLEKQLQQAQRLESVGRLAGGVAHDFNNMLVVIIGHASMGLMEADPGHSSYKHLQAIYSAAERSSDLTRQLLAFARKQTIEPQVVDLNDAISRMLKMLQRLIGEEVELTFRPGTTRWPVKMDPSQIDQIMANLCVNARDAIVGPGSITIETGALTVDAAYRILHPDAAVGEYVCVSVRDDGCGMDRETMSHIFEPFFTTKALGTGTGLGLSTIYGIVKQNSGFINVDSEPGKGTTFTIGIPKGTGAEAGISPTEPAPELPHGKETILLVEDEAAILQMTAQALRNWGYCVLPASSPGEAMQMAREQKAGIDLLMTDVIMPEMNGKDLALHLQKGFPDLKCLFMSGYTADVIAQHGVLDQRKDFIQKPFALQTLAVKVREVLDQVPAQPILHQCSR